MGATTPLDTTDAVLAAQALIDLPVKVGDAAVPVAAIANTARVTPGTPGPKCDLVQPAANQTFQIDGNANMPVITAEVRVTGVSPDPTASTDFTWTAQLTFDASHCRHGPRRQINSPVVTQVSHGGQTVFTLPRVRGGVLTITARATVGGDPLTVQSSGLRIDGTNPPINSVHIALPHDTLRRIARLESGCRQFDATANGGVSVCPLWSSDNLGGVGIMQVTPPRTGPPPPSDDEVWNWQMNVQRGVRIFNDKVPLARRYPGQVRATHTWVQMVAAYNADRAAQHLPPLQVQLSDFTETGFAVPPDRLGQVELDAVRGYNGWNGRDAFGLPLHEFRVETDAHGLLVVDQVPGTNRGAARWVRVPAANRPQRSGDPDYVNHVLAEQPC